MKETGILRKIDSLGRIVIPMEIRKVFDIREDDFMEIFINKKLIVLEKHEKKCVICNNSRQLKMYNGKLICDKCKNIILYDKED